MARNVVKYVKKQLRKRKSNNGLSRNRATVERHLFLLILTIKRAQGNHSKMQGQIGNSHGSRYASEPEDDESSYRHRGTHSQSNKIQKSRHACIVEAHESTRKRWKGLCQKIPKITLRKKGFNLLSHYDLAHKFVPMPQAMKIPDAKAAVDPERERLETVPAWDLETSKTRRRFFWKHKEDKIKSTLLH